MNNKTLILGDIHIGARSSSSVFRQLFREYFRDVIFPLVKEQEIETIIQLGDFFDNRNSITLQDIDYVLNEFIPQLEETDADLYVLAGNHDVAYKNTNKVNSLSLLKTSLHVEVVENKVEVLTGLGEKKFVLCPWVNNENYDALMDELKFYATDEHILCGHFEFSGFPMYKNSMVCENGMNPSYFKYFHKVISGHFHHRSTQGNVSYMGAVFHLTWMDHNDWRGFYLYNPDTNQFESHENEYCLFTKLFYHEDDLLNMKEDDLKDLCSEQYVIVVINDEYKRVDLKDMIHRIEKFNPLSLDIVDNTVIESATAEDKEIELSDTKDIREYTSEYLGDDEDKTTLLNLFDVIFNEAKESMKEL